MQLAWTDGRRHFGTLQALGLAGAGGLAVARWLPVARLPFWRCVLREHTGWPCPGCGLTRAADGIAHGRFAAAFSANPLGALAACLFALAAVLAVVQWVFRLPLPVVRFSPDEARRGRLALGAALVLNWLFVVVHTVPGLR